MEIIQKIDVESCALTVAEALAKVENEIQILSLTQVKILKIVHGYGSKGCGGEIKKELQFLLKKMQKFNKILDFITSEKFSITNKIYQKYTKIYPQLLLDCDIKNLNPGITIVFLK